MGGKVRHRGSLAKLLGVEIEVDEHVSDVEYMSSAVTKAELGGSVPMTAKARISFSSTPGLYLKGTRRVHSARNLDTVFGALSKANVDWSFLNRIVVETHSVENAEIYCSGGQAAYMKATYGANGVPVSLDASAALEHQQLLHIPNVTGTIAFSPVWLLFGFALRASSGGGKEYDFGRMDVNNPEDYEPEETVGA